MTAKTKQLIDYVPFVVLISYSIWGWLVYYQPGIVIKWQMYLGLALIMIDLFLLIKKHFFGVLLLAFINLLGLLGIISVIPAISSGFVEWNSLTLPFADPIFILFLIVHFICCGRYYIGIATREYWLNIKRNS